MGFALSVGRWSAKKKDQMDQIVTGTIGGILRGLDSRSPVGDRELWAINHPKLLQQETYQVFREDSGKARVSKKTLERKFGTLQPKGYVGGRFRANWQLGVDAVPQQRLFQPSPPQAGYPSGEETIQRNLALIPKQAGGHVYWIVNNLPYARRLEDGWSTQAPPGGIVALTTLEFQQYVDAARAAAHQ